MGQTIEIAIILAKIDKDKYSAIIKRAALNGYHDFKFDSISGHPEYGDTNCPKLILVEHLSSYPELNDIREQVINGMYDESPDKEDDINTYNMLMNENAPDKLFEIIGLQAPTEKERIDFVKSTINN